MNNNYKALEFHVIDMHFKISFLNFWLAGSLLLREFFAGCGERGLLSGCGAQASHCSGFSCFRAQALKPVSSVLVAPGL